MYDVITELQLREREILEKVAFRNRAHSRRLPRAESRRSTRRYPGRPAGDRTGA